MTDIEKKALALVNEVRAEYGYTAPVTYDWFNADSYEHLAFLRAIEQHEAFKLEVSEAVEDVVEELRPTKVALLSRFIIAKPDPLVEAISEVRVSPRLRSDQEMADEFRAAIEARGGRIVWEGE